MSKPTEPRTTLVMDDIKDARGSMWRAVHLSNSGELAIEGHDLGPRVESTFGGCREYEFERRLSRDETSDLRRILGLTGDQDLLDEIADQFESSSSLEAFLTAHAIPGKFWSRIGD